MLKKRILASSMASVMALSGVSVAAFADTKDYGEAVTKAELEEYIKSFDKFLETDIEDYGSTQGEHFQDAIDHAQMVIDEEDSKAADYTAAYQMVKAVYEKLEMKSKADLQGLLKEWQSVYDTNNIMNEDLQDNIYSEDSYSEFSVAYDDADRYVDSGDSRIITDAYFDLKEAADNLEKLDSVTKAEFRAALKAYEGLVESERDYETWRRGKVSVNFTSDSQPDDTATWKDNRKKLADADYVAYGDLYIILCGASDVDIAGVKMDNKTTWLPVGSEATAADFIAKKYKDFDAIKASRETTDPDIVLAYNAAVEAVSVFKSWTEDNTKRSTKAGIATLLKEYHNDLLDEFCYDGSTLLIDLIVANINLFTDASFATVAYDPDAKVLKAPKPVFACVKDGFVQDENDFFETEAAATAALDSSRNEKVQKISANTDILKYVPFDVADVTAAASAIPDETTAQGAYNTAVTDYNTAAAALKTAVDGILAESTINDITVTAGGAGATVADACVLDATKGTNGVVATPAFSYDNAGVEVKVAATSNKYYKLKSADYTDGGTLAAYTGKLDAVITALATFTTEKGNMEAAKANLDKAQEGADLIVAYGDLETALNNYDTYSATPFNAVAAEGIMTGGLDTWGNISQYKGSAAEWTLIYRKVLYALNDIFPEPDDTYTLKQLKTLIDDCYDLADKTGDSSLFAAPHADLVDIRKEALEWYTAARKTKGYKEGDKISVPGNKWNNKNATKVYNDLKKKYDALNKWLTDFKYSYGDIQATIAEVAQAIEDKKITATDDVKKYLTETAYGLSTLEATEIKDSTFVTGGEDINQPFDEERVLDVNNRLKTNNKVMKIKPSDAEKALLKNYENLLKAYDAAKGGSGDVKDFDFDGDGKFSLGDVSAALDAYLADSKDTKYDYDGNGTFELADVSKMLDAYLAL